MIEIGWIYDVITDQLQWRFTMDSPPEMPVPLKHMYKGNILRDDFITFIPTYPPMWHTRIS